MEGGRVGRKNIEEREKSRIWRFHFPKRTTNLFDLLSICQEESSEIVVDTNALEDLNHFRQLKVRCRSITTTSKNRHGRQSIGMEYKKKEKSPFESTDSR
uniref:Uncharacterized protein n=1 Tax=Pristionchus pacificus TaxID=54126 RepID=A0A2A6CUQ9_PRIPA|eukprot:PDM81826.1 hypothetical protein PRIPAC_33980 [Pristionchus pacificus]